MIRSKAFWNPLDSTGGYVIPHLIILLLLAAGIFFVGFASGWNTRAVYDSAYFQKAYRFPGLKTPQPGVSAPVRDVRHVGLAPTGSIRTGTYPAVGDQGPLGECAAYSSAWDASYEMRVTGGFGWIRLSPIYEYSYYSGRYAGGQDGGSWPDQDLELLSSSGLPRFSQVPTPPYQILNPLPTTDANGAPLRMVRTPFQIHVISGFAQGGGQGAVDAARAAIADNHPVMWALPVYPEYDNATQQPLIVSPQPGEFSRGGHANVFLKYDDTKVFPDGTVGGFLTRNQWSTRWGIAGNAWVSYDFVRRYSFGLEYLTIGAQAPHSGAKPTFRANPKTHLTKPPYDPGDKPRVGAGAASWYVHGVHLYNRSSGADISSIINSVGDQYHVWPVAISAVIGTESAFSPFAERWAGGLDNSCGLMQQIITNVYARIGNVGARAACNWEEIPGNSITFGADILHQNDLYHGGRVGWPFAYGMYNTGPGYPDSYYYNMTGQAYVNFTQNFLPWYRYSLANFAGGAAPLPPPPPKPPKPFVFPIKKFGHTVPHLYHGKLSWAASVWLHHQNLGRAARSRWHPRRHHGFTQTDFAHGTIWAWPAFHRAKVLVRR